MDGMGKAEQDELRERLARRGAFCHTVGDQRLARGGQFHADHAKNFADPGEGCGIITGEGVVNGIARRRGPRWP